MKVHNNGYGLKWVKLTGRRTDPRAFRVELPFGDVEIAKCDDGSYWVHIGADNFDKPGAMLDARKDKPGPASPIPWTWRVATTSRSRSDPRTTTPRTSRSKAYESI